MSAEPRAFRSDLQAGVDEAFARGGALHSADALYRPRDAQLRMAAAVVAAIEHTETLAVEAGTGVGKTYAYLVPALLAGRRTLVSTATKSLQDQLFLRDLPRLRAMLAVPLTAALLKGRASYLCLHRLGQARATALNGDRMALRSIARIETWAQATTSGDLAELEGLDERSPAIPLVTSTRENCLGSDCPQYRACHVLKARREAMAADLVVVNHHLFFADLRLRETGVAELLPSVELVIFDEAHQLTDAGIGFLGDTLGSTQVSDLARDVLHLGLTHARGLQPWAELTTACDTAVRELRLAVGGSRESATSQRSRWADVSERPGFAIALQRLGEASQRLAEALGIVAGTSPDLDKLAERALALADRAAAFAEPAASDRVRWVDRSAHGLRLVESPLDVREALREQIDAAPRTWVFTSATLGSEATLRWFTAQAGLDAATTLQIGSPFDYANHARLYVPQRFPKPNTAEHTASVARLAADCARAAGGRSFVLTTSLRALAEVGERLRDLLADDAIEVLVQGSALKRQLLQRFIDRPRVVLVGSQSFWEGIDVVGDALQCVVIDKLPFPPPNDPLVEARVRRIEAEGGDAFSEHFLAETAVALKQGAGRLIRSETDRGLLVICDPRMSSMGYGRKLLAALPPMPRLAEESEALNWLAEIAAERMES